MAKKKARSTKEPKPGKDRLEAAVNAKEIVCTILERELTIKKWTLRQSLRITSKVMTIIQYMLPTGSMADLLSVDLAPVVEKHEDDFVYVLVASVLNNFGDDESKAREWVEELGLDDALDLFSVIGKLNLRPLMQKLGEMKTLAAGLDAGLNAAESKSGEKAPPSLI